MTIAEIVRLLAPTPPPIPVPAPVPAPDPTPMILILDDMASATAALHEALMQERGARHADSS